MIESRLADGTLRISREITRQCAGCGHMVGTGSHPCNACGSTVTRDYAARHLVAERAPGRPVLAHEHLYAHKRRLPQHLCDIAGNAPRRLILSRTRDHGISLEPLGLQRAVLDPRVGVHITVLAAAVQRRADVAVMTTTQNAAANIAAYGQLFREHAGLRLLYALHGRVPYEHIARQREVRESRQVDTAARSAFETWFLPLYSLKEKSGVRADQLPALSRYFRRALLARPAQPGAAVLRDIRRSVTNGDLDWVMRQNALAHVMRL